MTSQERVRAAIEHVQPDKIPIDLGSNVYATMHVSTCALLREYFGLKGPVKVGIPFGMQAVVEDDLIDAMQVDTKGILEYENVFGYLNGMVDNQWKEWRTPQGLDVLVPKDFQVTDDGRGGYYMYPQGDMNAQPSGHLPPGGLYFDLIERQEPLNDNELNPQDNLEEYVEVSDAELTYFKKEAEAARKTGKAVYCNFGRFTIGNHAYIAGPSLKHPKGIRSIQEWFMAAVSEPEYVEEVFEKATDITIRNLEKYYKAVGENIDILMVCGVDWGTQRAPLYSKNTVNELYVPFLRRINKWIHENTHWKTFKHCCGAIEPLIPSIIEAGFDILNPIQVSAAGMDRELLKRKYGEKLAFWGGGLDTQRTLPFGTPEEIREEVLRSCDIFGKGGGYIFTQVHSIQANTPIENILAMLNAVREFNGDTPL